MTGVRVPVRAPALAMQVGKKHGVETIPQLAYWRELPPLVRDGCKYSWEQAKKAYFKYVVRRAVPCACTQECAPGKAKCKGRVGK